MSGCTQNSTRTGSGMTRPRVPLSIATGCSRDRRTHQSSEVGSSAGCRRCLRARRRFPRAVAFPERSLPPRPLALLCRTPAWWGRPSRRRRDEEIASASDRANGGRWLHRTRPCRRCGPRWQNTIGADSVRSCQERRSCTSARARRWLHTSPACAQGECGDKPLA